MVDLIADGQTHVVEYDLKPRYAKNYPEDQSGIKGTIRVKGGKSGYVRTPVRFTVCLYDCMIMFRDMAS